MLKPIRLHPCLPSYFTMHLDLRSLILLVLTLLFLSALTMGIPCPLRNTMCQRVDAVHLLRKDLLLRPDKHSVPLHSIPIRLLLD